MLRRTNPVLRVLRGNLAVRTLTGLFLLAGIGVGLAGAAARPDPTNDTVRALLLSTEIGALSDVNALASAGAATPGADVPVSVGSRNPAVTLRTHDHILTVDTVTGLVTTARTDTLCTQIVSIDRHHQLLSDGTLVFRHDTRDATITQVDPDTLQPVGPVLAHDVVGTPVGRSDTIWALTAGGQAVIRIRHGRTHKIQIGPSESDPASGPAGSQEKLLAARPDGLEVLSTTAGKVVTIAGDTVTGRYSISDPASGRATALRGWAVAEDGATSVALVDRGPGTNILIHRDGPGDGPGARTSETTLPPGSYPGQPLVTGNRVYLADQISGRLLIFTVTAPTDSPEQVQLAPPGTPVELFATDMVLWANAVDGPNALAIVNGGTRRQIVKYHRPEPVESSPRPSVPVASSKPVPSPARSKQSPSPSTGVSAQVPSTGSQQPSKSASGDQGQGGQSQGGQSQGGQSPTMGHPGSPGGTGPEPLPSPTPDCRPFTLDVDAHRNGGSVDVAVRMNVTGRDQREPGDHRAIWLFVTGGGLDESLVFPFALTRPGDPWWVDGIQFGRINNSSDMVGKAKSRRLAVMLVDETGTQRLKELREDPRYGSEQNPTGYAYAVRGPIPGAEEVLAIRTNLICVNG